MNSKIFGYIIGWCSISVLSILLLGACNKSGDTVVNFQLEGMTQGMQPILTVGGKRVALAFDSLGFASFYPDGRERPQDGMLECGEYRLLLYIQPEKSFDVYINLAPSVLGAEFKGAGALENEVLNGDIFSSALKIDYRQDERTFIAGRETDMKEGSRLLDSLSLHPDFVSFAKEKLKYTVFSFLGDYPKQHAALTGSEYHPSDFFVGYVKNLITEDEKWLEFVVYKEAMLGWVKVAGISDNPGKFARLEGTLEYIDTAMHNAAVTEFIVDRIITDYVEKAGADSLSRLVSFYNGKVKNPVLRENFEHLCAMWKRIQLEEPAPDMQTIGRDSLKTGAEDLAGRYAYLLFWKTNCDLSEQEVTYLKELEIRMKKKNVQFVGISCDTDRETWEKYLDEEHPAGVQWYLENAPFVLDYYRIHSLPYAVLLNPHGRIVKVGIPLPSDWRLTAVLSQLMANK